MLHTLWACIKLRHCEKATKFKKKSPTSFDVYSVVSKQVRDFFQIFVAFSEYLTFKNVLA